MPGQRGDTNHHRVACVARTPVWAYSLAVLTSSPSPHVLMLHTCVPPCPRSQLVSAVEYCHRNNVAHRDLKLDNTLLDNHVPSWLKLCDFGFAKHWQVGRAGAGGGGG